MRSYGFALIAVYLGAGIVFRGLLDAPSGADFVVMWRYLAVPMAAIAVAAAWIRRRQQPRGPAGFSSPWLAVGLFYIVALIVTPSWVLFANSVGASGPAVTFDGPVVSKWTRSYKTTSHCVQIQDDVTGRRLTFIVSPDVYRSLAVGSRFRRTFSVGRFGIPYRWNLG